jgi:hypothetical protein
MLCCSKERLEAQMACLLSSDEKGYSSQIYQNKQGVCLRMKDFINESCCYSPVLWQNLSMHDSGLPLTPDELIADVMVAGLYHKYCCWSSQNMCLTFAIFWIISQFFLYFLSGASHLFPICWYVVGSEMSITVLSGVYSILFKFR